MDAGPPSSPSRLDLLRATSHLLELPQYWQLLCRSTRRPCWRRRSGLPRGLWAAARPASARARAHERGSKRHSSCARQQRCCVVLLSFSIGDCEAKLVTISVTVRTMPPLNSERRWLALPSVHGFLPHGDWHLGAGWHVFQRRPSQPGRIVFISRSPCCRSVRAAICIFLATRKPGRD